MAAYYTSANGIWTVWTSCTSSATTWAGWCDYADTSSATTACVWPIWASDGTSANYIPVPEMAAAPVSEAERVRLAEERARRAEEALRLSEEAKKKAEAAERRAARLLRKLLTPEQRKEYDQSRSFHVVGADGERYRVADRWAGHVERIVNGKPVERFCIHPYQQVPIPDNQLVAKLMLETDPAGFRKTANVTRLTG